ncbi:MAG TPA: hypothetical protein VIH21_03470 [Dehalococcoidia bacterium]
MIESGGATYKVDSATGHMTRIMVFPTGLADDPLTYLHQYAVSPDGRVVAAGCATDNTLARIPPNGANSRLCLFSDGDNAGRPIATQTDFVRGRAIGGPWASDPYYWSPDGHKIVFYVAIDEASSDVYVADVVAGTVKRVLEGTSGTRASGAVWSPDSTRFAVALLALDAQESASLFVVGAEDGGTTNLNATIGRLARASMNSVTWSPDAKFVAFTAIDGRGSGSSGSEEPHVYVVSADGSSAHQVATIGLPADYTSPLSWSPDGLWLVARLIIGKYTDINANMTAAYLLRVDDAEQRVLGQSLSPSPVAWAADGKRGALWAFGATSHTFALIQLDVAGPPRLVDAALAGRSGLSLYPFAVSDADQTRIFYSLRGCGQGGCSPGPLFMVDVDGGDPQQLSDKPVERLLGIVGP